MIDTRKVRRMTKMSIYEQKYGAADGRIMSYFRGDYLTRQALITFFCSTAAFFILALTYIIYHFETLLVEIYSMDIRMVVMRVLIAYLIFVGGMMILTVVIYNHRYTQARKRVAAYYRDLVHLSGGTNTGKYRSKSRG